MGQSKCDDGNPCTDDGCAPLAGCFNTPNQLPCDDGDPCTDGDVCQAGACVSGPASGDACDDQNPCTQDLCVQPDGCLYEAVLGPCDDGDPCTFGDHCADGVCAATGEKTCVDGNPCTDDSCEAGIGCTFVPNTASCDDGDPCTLGDLCAGGGCHGEDVLCDDENPCTADLCDRGTGDCLFVPTAGPCDDEDPCTQTACLGGECVVQSLAAGCCASHEDCASPWEACDDAHACVDIACAACVDDADCGADGNRCVVIDGTPRCLIGCGGEPGVCPADAPCTLSTGGGWICLPAPGACDVPDPTGDGVVLGDAIPGDAGGGGDLVTVGGGASSGCAAGPAGSPSTALLLFLCLILWRFGAARFGERTSRRTWRSIW